MRVIAPSFMEMTALDGATSRAADIIYADFPHRGPCVAGDTSERCMSLLLYVDDDTLDAWLPQLKVLCQAVDGTIESISVGSYIEDDG